MPLALAGPAPGGLFTERGEEEAVTCRFDPESGILVIRLHAIRLKLGNLPGIPNRLEEELKDLIKSLIAPTVATIERRFESITVLRDYDGRPVACKGPRPTVTNTDTIRVRRGEHAQYAELYLDLRHGPLAPGATDEGDGSSEIELDANPGGVVSIRGARGSDRIDLTGRATAIEINLNAGEPVPDPDLLVSGDAFVFVAGAGAGDVLRSAGEFPTISRYVPLMGLIDGQGDDVLEGHGGDESFMALAGHDTVRAGAGADLVYASSGDVVDCGGGHDWLIRLRKPIRARNCEQVVDLARLYSHSLESEQVEVLFRGVPRRLGRIRAATVGYFAHRLSERRER